MIMIISRYVQELKRMEMRRALAQRVKEDLAV